MKPTFRNEEHLSGFIDAFIYLFEVNNGDFQEDYNCGYIIKKIEKTYNITFYWNGERFIIQRATRDEPKEYDWHRYNDGFMILEDESISKLEQFVTDTLQKVIDTDLEY